MDSPPLQVGTSATVVAVPYLDLAGGVVAITLIKERFHADRRGRVNRVGGAQVRYADDLWDPDSPETSTVRAPSDICLAKPSTDVVVAGAAVSRGGARAPELDVLVRVGPVEKALRVFGPRVWRAGLTGLALTSPEPFERLDLRWELAYGGADFEEGQRPLEEARNPAGRGVARDPKKLAGLPGPQIEDPRDLIKSHRSHPAPAGVAAIGRHWLPRRSYLGTIDERWMEERMPLLPLDHDPRFNQVATPEMIAPRPLRGGEAVQVLNMNEEGPIGFELPWLAFSVSSHGAARAPVEHRPVLDTVLLEPNERLVELTWRAIVPLPRRARDLDFIQVVEKRVGGAPS